MSDQREKDAGEGTEVLVDGQGIQGVSDAFPAEDQ
jgi:hypothetical protein